MVTMDELKDALCDVRKAHRIIYAYQRRMMDIAHFIQHKLNFPTCECYKKFSNMPSKRIYPETWAWDFLYTYLMEYHLGERKTADKKYALSIIQYSDTGYFEGNAETQKALAKFASEEESGTKLMFFIEATPAQDERIWGNKLNEVIMSQYHASKEHTQDSFREKNSVFGVYSIPAENLINEELTLKVLKEFCQFCNDEGICDISIV